MGFMYLKMRELGQTNPVSVSNPTLKSPRVVGVTGFSQNNPVYDPNYQDPEINDEYQCYQDVEVENNTAFDENDYLDVSPPANSN